MTGASPVRQVVGGIVGSAVGALVWVMLFLLWIGLLVEVVDTRNAAAATAGMALAAFVGTNLGARVARAAGRLSTPAAALAGPFVVVGLLLYDMVATLMSGDIDSGGITPAGVVATAVLLTAAAAGGLALLLRQTPDPE